MYRQRDFHANGKRRQQRQPESYRQLQPRDAGSHSDGLGWSSGFSLSVAPSSHSIAAGSNASYILTVDPSGGFSGTVQLACRGAPSKATCTLAKTSVVLDGSSAITVNVTVTTTSPSVTALSRPSQFPFRKSSFWIFWIIGLGPAAALLLARRRRAAATIGMSVLALVLVSCGGGGNSGGGGGGGSIPGTPPGTYDLTLSGTSGEHDAYYDDHPQGNLASRRANCGPYWSCCHLPRVSELVGWAGSQTRVSTPSREPWGPRICSFGRCRVVRLHYPPVWNSRRESNPDLFVRTELGPKRHHALDHASLTNVEGMQRIEL